VAAWVIGTRSMQKALLYALLQPGAKMKAMQDEGRFTELLMFGEELKIYPFGDIWDEYCRRQQVPVGIEWFPKVQQYEADVLSRR
jgi:L-rhamnose isomerase